jgi:hypothetical protein
MAMPTAPAFNAPLGTPPTLEWVPVAAIGIDTAYQRTIDNEASQRFIRAIARDWDWSMCLPLKLSRRDDGSVWAVDGQHRQAAAQLRGDIPHLPCVIGRYDSNADEAAAFVALNRQRRALSAVDLFVASLAAGNAEAIEVLATIKAAGLRLAPHSNFTAWTPGQIYCIPGVQRAYRQRGPLPTSKALVTLAHAFDGQVLRYAGLLLDGLYEVFTGRGREGNFDRIRFESVLSDVAQGEWLHRALTVQARDGSSRTMSIATAMLAAYDGMSGTQPRVAPIMTTQVRVAEKPRRTFEETLAAVEAGTVTVSDKVPMVRAEPVGAFGSSMA